ncbi:MAG: F0F1 ATP synthase subunit delta, partial [Armatimonadota bacterium]
MAYDGRVAKRYARAFFSAAKADGMVAAVDTDLTVVANTLHTSAGFRDFMGRPSTSESDK